MRRAFQRIRTWLYFPLYWMRLKHLFREWRYNRTIARARHIIDKSRGGST